MTKRLFAYFLYVLGLFISVFFRNLAGLDSSYQLIFWLAGIALWVAGYFLLKKSPTFKEHAALNKLKETISILKEHGEKIVVDLSQVEIKENNYSEEQDIYKSDLGQLRPGVFNQIEMLNALSDETKNTKVVDIRQSVIIYTYNNNGVNEKFISDVILKDKETLLFKFFAQKNTTLYIDSYNRKLYYFDLDFLYN